jgi:uncharacterized membrane protein
MKIWTVFWAMLAATAAVASDKIDVSKLPPAASRKDVTYEKDIKPILEKTCVKCHGAEKQKGKLRLDTLENVLKGGENGEIVAKNKSAESLMVIAVARLDEDTAMPPEGKADPLTKDEVGLIRAWIDQGAK